MSQDMVSIPGFSLQCSNCGNTGHSGFEERYSWIVAPDEEPFNYYACQKCERIAHLQEDTTANGGENQADCAKALVEHDVQGGAPPKFPPQESFSKPVVRGQTPRGCPPKVTPCFHCGNDDGDKLEIVRDSDGVVLSWMCHCGELHPDCPPPEHLSMSFLDEPCRVCHNADSAKLNQFRDEKTGEVLNVCCCGEPYHITRLHPEANWDSDLSSTHLLGYMGPGEFMYKEQAPEIESYRPIANVSQNKDIPGTIENNQAITDMQKMYLKSPCKSCGNSDPEGFQTVLDKDGVVLIRLCCCGESAGFDDSFSDQELLDCFREASFTKTCPTCDNCDPDQFVFTQEEGNLLLRCVSCSHEEEVFEVTGEVTGVLTDDDKYQVQLEPNTPVVDEKPRSKDDDALKCICGNQNFQIYFGESGATPSAICVICGKHASLPSQDECKKTRGTLSGDEEDDDDEPQHKDKAGRAFKEVIGKGLLVADFAVRKIKKPIWRTVAIEAVNMVRDVKKHHESYQEERISGRKFLRLTVERVCEGVGGMGAQIFTLVVPYASSVVDSTLANQLGKGVGKEVGKLAAKAIPLKKKSGK